MTVDCSLGETETLVMRAGRGVGLSWGQAEEAGRAVTRLAAAGFPSVSWLVAALPKIELTPYDGRCPALSSYLGTAKVSKKWSASEPATCPIALGCGLADALPIFAQRSATVVLEFEAVWSPALVAGLVLPVADRLGQSVCLQFDQGALLVMHGLVSSDSDMQNLPNEQAQHILITIGSPGDIKYLPAASGRRPADVTRCSIDDVMFAKLKAYAQRTYVPSTASARTGGAGAGLNDND